MAKELQSQAAHLQSKVGQQAGGSHRRRDFLRRLPLCPPNSGADVGRPLGQSPREAKVSRSHRFSGMKGDGGKEEASRGGMREGDVIGRLRCEVSTFRASEAAKPELVRLAYSHLWAANLGRGSPGAKDGATGVSFIRRLVPAISSDLFLTRTDLPASVKCRARGKHREGGALPSPSQGQPLPPSGLMPQPHLLKNELQVPSWGWGLEFWLGVGIPRSSLKRRSLPPGSRGGLGLRGCWLGFSAVTPCHQEGGVRRRTVGATGWRQRWGVRCC